MPREFNRSERVADFVRRELSTILQKSLRDPRLAGVNVNEVVVTRDLSLAKVYVTFLDLDADESPDPIVEVLNGAAGFLRTELAARSTMRSTPKLRFYFDEATRTGERLSRLIDQAINKDGAG